MRDLYKLELEVFSDPKQVAWYTAWYTAAVGMLGLHLWLGWSKTIYKMGLPKAYVKPADCIGHALLAPLTIVYYLSQQAAGGAGRGEL
jgi:hypothetical protein